MVQECSHTVLLSVSPLVTLLATLLAMLVSVYDVLVSVFIFFMLLNFHRCHVQLIRVLGWGWGGTYE